MVNRKLFWGLYTRAYTSRAMLHTKSTLEHFYAYLRVFTGRFGTWFEKIDYVSQELTKWFLVRRHQRLLFADITAKSMATKNLQRRRDELQSTRQKSFLNHLYRRVQETGQLILIDDA